MTTESKTAVIAEGMTALLHELIQKQRQQLVSIDAVVCANFGLPTGALERGCCSREILLARKVRSVLASELLVPRVGQETMGYLTGVPKSTWFRHLAQVREKEMADPAFALRLQSLRTDLRKILN